MARTTTTLGGGLSDTGTYNWNGAAGDDWVSNWAPSGGYNHGGFTSTAGTTVNSTVKPVSCVRLEMRLGGTAAGYASAVKGYLELATANDGSGGYNNSLNVHTTTGTTATYSTGDIAVLASGTVGTISGSAGAWVYRISGLSSTSALKLGQYVAAHPGTGAMSVGYSYISTIVSSTTIELTSSATIGPVAGTVSNVYTFNIWNVESGTTYYYGFYTTTAAWFINANGGSTGSYWRNATLVNSGTKLSGRITYDTVPSAPGSPGTPGSGTTAGTPAASNVTPTGMTLTWCKGSDDGVGTWDDTYILGWQIIYKKTTDTAWGVLVSNTQPSGQAGLTYDSVTGNYSYNITGLKPGTSYDFQVAALNHVTLAIQSDPNIITAQVGLRSLTLTQRTTGGVYNGSAWVTPSTYTCISTTQTIGSGWSSSAPSGTPYVVSLPSGHVVVAGDYVYITGTGNTNINGWQYVSATTGTSMTISAINSSGTTTGSLTGGNAIVWRYSSVYAYSGSAWVDQGF